MPIPLGVLLAALVLVAVPSGARLCVPVHAAMIARPLVVVASIPVLKDLAEQIGGHHVEVLSLLTGLESEHTYSPKPSDLMAVRRARVLLQVGIGLEVWLTSLVKSANNRDLVVVTTSNGIALIRDREVTEPPLVESDSERGGNPHVWLDPENAKIMLRHITDGFISVDPEHAPDYRDNLARYLRELDQVQTDLIARVRRLQDRRVVVHHPAWPYFARRFGFRIEGEILKQPGTEPSARQLQRLVEHIRRTGIRVIVSEPQLNRKIPETVARETGSKVVVLTAMPGALPGTATYADLLRYNVATLVDALS